MECSGLYYRFTWSNPFMVTQYTYPMNILHSVTTRMTLSVNDGKALKVLAQFYPKGAKNQIKTRRTMIEKMPKIKARTLTKTKQLLQIISTISTRDGC